MKTVFRAVYFCFLLAGFLAGRQAAAGDEIVIGTHNSLSGVGAVVGREQQWAYAQAIKDINRAGGIYLKEAGKKLPVKLITMDDESDPGKAATATQYLIRQCKVDLMLGGQIGAMGTLPGMITAEKYRTYYHGGVIWPQTFLEHNFKYCTMYFFDPVHGGIMPFEVFNSVPEDQRPKRPALCMEDSFDGKTMGDVWADIGKQYGYEMTLRTSMGMGEQDFTSQVMEARQASADAILCMANVPETVTLVRQLKENRVNIKWFQGFKGTWSNDFWKALGSDAEGILLDGFWSMDYDFPGATELGERYFHDHQEYSVSVGYYYAIAHILLQAIEKAGTLDDLKVRRTVIENEWMSTNGPVKYDKKGIALFPLGNFQWRNGKQVLLYPLDRAKAKAVPMQPWDSR